MKSLKMIVLSLLIVSCGEKKLDKGKYRLKGTVKGMTEGKLYLMKFPKTDTIKVKDGKFQWEGTINQVADRVFITNNLNNRSVSGGASLYIEPAIMKINVDINHWKATKLTGSKTQDDQYRLDEVTKNIEAEYQKELTNFNSIRKKYNTAYKAKASKAVLEAIEEEDYQARGKLEPYYTKIRKASLTFIKDNPNSFVSLNMLLYQLGELKYPKAIAIYNTFSKSLKNTTLGKDLFSEIAKMKKGVPGAIAGNFNTTDINGKPIKLADFKGKYLLIDFWASWCMPCRKGNPHLISLFKKYHSKGLQILGVSDDDRNPDAWKIAVKKDKIAIWHHVLRGSAFDRKTGKNKYPEKDISQGYNISSLPTKILVNPAGVIIGRYGSGGEKEEAMDKKLAELF